MPACAEIGYAKQMADIKPEISIVTIHVRRLRGSVDVAISAVSHGLMDHP